MFKSLICSICILVSITNLMAQEVDVTFDYEVTYVVPNAKKNTTDTLKIQLDKQGHYLFMESPSMGLNLARGVFPNPNMDLSNAECSFLLDTQRMLIYFNFRLDDTVMFLQMDVEPFIPTDRSPIGDSSAAFNLISEKRSEKIQVGDASYNAYMLFPETEPDEPITMVIDEQRPVDNIAIIHKAFTLMMEKTQSTTQFNLDVPNGLIMAIGLKDEMLIRAIEAKDVTTKINIQHSFNIKE